MTGHTIILGLSGSGKTSMAKAIAKGSIDRKRRVMVLDPMADPQWREMGCELWIDSLAYLEQVKKCRSCTLVIDEGGTSIGRDPKFHFLTTSTRHYGHTAIIIAHRPSQLPPVLRENCDRLFMFSSSRTAREIIAIEWDLEDELPTKYERGEFIMLSRDGNHRRGRIDFKTRVITWIASPKSEEISDNPKIPA